MKIHKWNINFKNRDHNQSKNKNSDGLKMNTYHTNKHVNQAIHRSQTKKAAPHYKQEHH